MERTRENSQTNLRGARSIYGLVVQRVFSVYLCASVVKKVFDYIASSALVP